MIELTRLNSRPFLLNPDLIKCIENAPDTVLTLVTGEKVLVSESSGQVVEKIVEFRRRIFPGLAFQAPRFAAASSERSEPLLLRREDRD